MKKKLSALILGLMVMSFAATVSAHCGPEPEQGPGPRPHQQHHRPAPHQPAPHDRDDR